MQKLPEHFVYLRDVDATIREDIRYATARNFVGRPVDGYVDSVAIMTRPLAEALSKAQKALTPQNLGFIVLDAYRPLRACKDFYKWSQDGDDQVMKAEYYPEFDKRRVFEEGYILEYSNHCRGSTVDLTIIELDTGKELDMGTCFDFLDARSGSDWAEIPAHALANRTLLNETLYAHGFKNYPQEWWHFELIDEPYPRVPHNPDYFFDFEVVDTQK